MRFETQLFKHNPPHTYGDCSRTCLACLLDLNPQDVPHFAEISKCDIEEWNRLERKFLLSAGFVKFQVAFIFESVSEALELSRDAYPGLYMIMLGQSKNGVNHEVIVCDGEIVWDPSIDKSGIVGPTTDTEAFHFSVLVPARFLKFGGGVE